MSNINHLFTGMSSEDIPIGNKMIYYYRNIIKIMVSLVSGQKLEQTEQQLVSN